MAGAYKQTHPGRDCLSWLPAPVASLPTAVMHELTSSGPSATKQFCASLDVAADSPRRSAEHASDLQKDKSRPVGSSTPLPYPLEPEEERTAQGPTNAHARCKRRLEQDSQAWAPLLTRLCQTPSLQTSPRCKVCLFTPVDLQDQATWHQEPPNSDPPQLCEEEIL